MRNNGTVIVYRSQQEANLDWFLTECLVPWVYNHGWHILGVVLFCGVAFYVKTRFDER